MKSKCVPIYIKVIEWNFQVAPKLTGHAKVSGIRRIQTLGLTMKTTYSELKLKADSHVPAYLIY